jgi:hypothetical protein
MTAEIWAVAAALVLAMAAVARGLALFREGKWWDRIATGARAAAALALAVALVLLAVAHGGWSPFDIGQTALCLALATLIVHLALQWRLKVDAAAPVVDLVALALALVGVLSAPSGGSLLTCSQRAAPFHVQWALFLLGAGGLIVAGSAGVMLALRTALTRHGRGLRWPLWIDLHAFLKQASALALVALGGGFTVSSWRAWQTVGSLTSGIPAEGWIVTASLIAAMSLLVRRVGKRWGRWAAGFAVLAAAVAILGVLAAADLSRVPGV